jgi:hypothetical protein
MNVEAPLKPIVLEPGKRSREVVEFEKRLRSRIIGQDEAVSQLVNVYQTVLAGMSGQVGLSRTCFFSVQPAQVRHGSWKLRPRFFLAVRRHSSR